MKIKFQATINNLSLKANGEYRICFQSPLLEISKAISMVRLLSIDFMVGILSENGTKAIITKAYFYKLAIDRDGESKVTISFPLESVTDNSLAFFGKNQENLVNVIIKNNEE